MVFSFATLEYKDVIKILQRLGFEQRPYNGGSHVNWVRFDCNSCLVKVTVPHHPGKTIKPGTLGQIYRQCGLSKKEFYKARNKKHAKILVLRKYETPPAE